MISRQNYHTGHTKKLYKVKWMGNMLSLFNAVEQCYARYFNVEWSVGGHRIKNTVVPVDSPEP